MPSRNAAVGFYMKYWQVCDQVYSLRKQAFDEMKEALERLGKAAQKWVKGRNWNTRLSKREYSREEVTAESSYGYYQFKVWPRGPGKREPGNGVCPLIGFMFIATRARPDWVCLAYVWVPGGKGAARQLMDRLDGVLDRSQMRIPEPEELHPGALVIAEYPLKPNEEFQVDLEEASKQMLGAVERLGKKGLQAIFEVAGVL